MLKSPIDQEWSLNIQDEGACLTALGIVDAVTQACRSRGKDPNTVGVSRWYNNIDIVPFHRDETANSEFSHFFDRSDTYRFTPIPCSLAPRLFGFFLGRRTFSRCRMLYDLWHTRHEDILFSVMRTQQPLPWLDGKKIMNLEKFEDWIDPEQSVGFCRWWETLDLPSVDGHSVDDQYVSGLNTNSDLLKHYDRFDIEIVAETYTLGNCFFPTEKTIRPISVGKPMLVYGPRHYLSRLRDLGYRTWSQYWDESYDDLEGPQRWQAMLGVIRDLGKIQVDPEIAEHNRQITEDVIRKDRSPWR